MISKITDGHCYTFKENCCRNESRCLLDMVYWKCLGETNGLNKLKKKKTVISNDNLKTVCRVSVFEIQGICILRRRLGYAILVLTRVRGRRTAINRSTKVVCLEYCCTSVIVYSSFQNSSGQIMLPKLQNLITKFNELG